MMKTALLLLPAIAALSACQTLPAKGVQAPYEAAGTEPFWGLSIDSEGITFSRAGERDIRFGRYEARPSFNGWRYTSTRISVDVTFTRCSDGMSDNIYKDSVTVMVDGTEYRGCGGGVVAPR